MQVTITNLIDHGTIVQMVGHDADNKPAIISWDHSQFRHFAEANSDLTLPFVADWERETHTFTVRCSGCKGGCSDCIDPGAIDDEGPEFAFDTSTRNW